MTAFENGTNTDVGALPGTAESQYAKPSLDRLGTFRELTQDDGSDFFGGILWHRPHRCMLTDSSSFTCHRGR